MDWEKELTAAITVCDTEGKIVFMNNKSAEIFADDGGFKLMDRSLFDCHSNASSEKIREIMQKQLINVYTIEKNGIKKLIYQSPWYEDGKMKGLVELSIEIPFEMPHFIRI